MRNAWLKTFAASVSAAAIAGGSVVANPALMASRPAPPKAAPTQAATQTIPAAPHNAYPSMEESSGNPFKKLGGSITKIAAKARRGASPNPVMNPSRADDAISLNTPVGAPTPDLFIKAAQLCETQGDVNLARHNFQEAMNRWPRDVEVLRAAARMEDRLGQLSVAETLYGKAVAVDPRHAGALNDLGLCLARQGKLDASVQLLEQAIHLQPAKPLYRNNAATVLVELRQDRRALAHLAAVHGAADANYNFGQLLVQRGRAPDATPYFQAAVDQNPQMQHAHVALAKLRGETQPATTQEQSPATPQTTPSYVPENGPTMSYPATAARTPVVVPQKAAGTTQPAAPVQPGVPQVAAKTTPAITQPVAAPQTIATAPTATQQAAPQAASEAKVTTPVAAAAPTVAPASPTAPTPATPPAVATRPGNVQR